jgi:hypothetical protein
MKQVARRFFVLACLAVVISEMFSGCTPARNERFYIRPSSTTKRKVLSFSEIYSEDYRLLGYLEHRSTLYEGLRHYVDEYFVYTDQFTPAGYIDEKGSSYIFDRARDLKRIGDYEIKTGTLRILGYAGKATFSREMK